MSEIVKVTSTFFVQVKFANKPDSAKSAMAQAAAAAASGGLGVYGSPMQFATGGPLHGAGPGPANQFRYTPLGGPGQAGPPPPGAMGNFFSFFRDKLESEVQCVVFQANRFSAPAG